jgi:transcriptional regulator
MESMAQRFMTAPEKDRLIWELRRRGWTLKKIGREVGMTAAGVSAALQRIADGRTARDPRPT